MQCHDNGTWNKEYHARFGALPDSQVTQCELERAVELGKTILHERDQLRAELARMQAERDRYLKALAARMASELPEVNLDRETLLAQIVRQPSLDQLIDELEREGT